MGEVSDKAIQSELQELEGTIKASQSKQNSSTLKDLLDKVPDGLFGGKDEKSRADDIEANAAAARMGEMNISPREPEAFTRQLQEITKQIYPILEYHDEIMHSITETIEQIPVLPDLLEQIQEQINIFVFSQLAPFVLPIIAQVKRELQTGSTAVIESSRDKQHVVFHDDRSSDPTHSMLSKDHFTNVLNEPAGKIATAVLKWVVPQIVECWDDDRADVDRTLDRIVAGVFHHPALRDAGDDGAQDGRQAMFRVVEGWWRDKSERERADLRDKLSRAGVESGRNHKEGLHDTGHGCGKPLGMPTRSTATSSGAIGGAVLSGLGDALGGGKSDSGNRRGGSSSVQQVVGKAAGDAVGGGALGGIVGGIVGGVGASLLGGAFGGKDDEKSTYKKESRRDDGSHTVSYVETGRHPGGSGSGDRYGQAQYSRTDYSGGGTREEYQRFEQDGREARAGYGFGQKVETKPAYGGGYERTEETRYDRPGGQWEATERREVYGAGGERESSETK